MTRVEPQSKMVVVKVHLILIAVTLSLLCAGMRAVPVQRLFVAPLYVEYTSSSADEFANEVAQLRQRIGQSSGVQVGFSAFLNLRFSDVEFNKPIDESSIKPTLADLDLIVSRAVSSQLPVHIAVASGFFHGSNRLRETAIRSDVRNAQWFSDGSIGDPTEIDRSASVPQSAWITPSRYAYALRERMQESMRIIGNRLAEAMERYPDTLLSISGDTEVELSFARYLDPEGRPRPRGEALLADYSPFAVAEFRDWIRQSRYSGDVSPATDDNHDGHTFNRDFHQQFRTWQLRYFDESGAIPYERYRMMTEKLPKSGPDLIDGGFDAPRAAMPEDPFWKAWLEFRARLVGNFVRDFGEWITAGWKIPASRFYTHQIPADFLFDGKDATRLRMSASPVDTAFIPQLASPGVTVYDTYDGKTHSRTSSTALFKRLQKAGMEWGILEYNPSVPAIANEDYYLTELRTLNSFHPSIIVPFAWTDAQQHRVYRIQNTAYERALKKFVQEAGNVIHR